MNPVVAHVIRPYESEEEFLEAEAWTIESRAMLLLDQQELPVDTMVVFDVGLSNGVKLMRAEARVVGFLPAEDGAPSALKVRFRRYGSQTKAFIERAVSIRQEQLAREAQRASSFPPEGASRGSASAAPPARQPSAPPARQPSAPPARRPSAPPQRASVPPGRQPSAPPQRASAPPARAPSAPPRRDSAPAPREPSVTPPPVASASPPAADSAPVSAPPPASVPADAEPRAVLEHRVRPLQEPSGVHRRPISEVAAPPNRDELLARLRERARRFHASAPSKSGTS